MNYSNADFFPEMRLESELRHTIYPPCRSEWSKVLHSKLFLAASAVLALLIPAALAPPAESREPYKDLPGVKVPKQIDKQESADCTSHFERQWPTDWRNGLSYRVYECENGGVTARSTRPPDEMDWQKRQQYYKPWTSDGF